MKENDQTKAYIQSYKMSIPEGTPGGFEAYRAVVAPIFEAELISEEEPFFAMSEVYCLADLFLSYTKCSGTIYSRDRKTIARTGSDDINVLIYRHGQYTFEVEGKSFVVNPDDIAFFDLRMPLSIRAESVDNMSLILPRRMLETLSIPVDDIHGHVLRGGVAKRLLIDYLESIRSVARTILATESRTISDVTVRHVAACLSSMSRRSMSSARNSGNVSLAEIKDAIERQLKQPDLNAASLMSQFNISRATLYRLFEPIGGVDSYIMERRLRQALNLMIDPSLPKPRIKQLAAEFGFSHSAAFSRAFRKLFGVSPSEARSLRNPPAGRNAKVWKNPAEVEGVIQDMD